MTAPDPSLIIATVPVLDCADTPSNTAPRDSGVSQDSDIAGIRAVRQVGGKGVSSVGYAV